MNVAILVIALCMTGVSYAEPMGTAFTYQGRLVDANSPADGMYDFEFKLYSSPDFPVLVGSTVVDNLEVTDGYFTVQLDFGSDAFNGDARWLETGVRPGELEDPNTYSDLSPRQELTSTPYAIYAENSAADGDWTISGSDMYTGAGVTGNVGIGTVSPQAKLTVNGAILRDGSTMYGSNADTHINLGTSSTTGTNGQDYSYATVGGGVSNMAMGDYTTVDGGYINVASNDYTTVGGGYANTSSQDYATVGGGYANTANGHYATVGAGQFNMASGDYATIPGGRNNTAGNDATVAGGRDNIASDNYATIGGGYDNEASYDYATVGGGQQNIAHGDWVTIGGGYDNDANAVYTTVGGGIGNTASNENATVGGGWGNTANGGNATVPGGRDNEAGGFYSFAAGRRAKVRSTAATGLAIGDRGTFVWADSTDADFTSTGPDQFLIRASGGVGIGTTNPGYGLDVAGDINFTGGLYQNGSAFVTGDGHSLDAADGSPTDVVYVDNDGDVGIGTTSPGQKLHVKDSATGNFVAKIENTATVNSLGLTVETDSSDNSAAFRILSAGSTNFYVRNSGRVGVGTVPQNKLDVEGAMAVGTFYAGTSTAPSNGMIVEGDVGIGTDTPARKLHVSDVMRLEPRASAPLSPSAGDIYYDSTDDMLKCYNGSMWKDCW